MAFQIDPNIPLQAGKVQFDPASILMEAQKNGAALEKHRFEMQKLREDYDLAKEKRKQEKAMQMGIASDLAGIQSGTPAQYAPMTYQQQPQRGQMPSGMTGVRMSEQGQQMPQPQVFGEDLMNGNYQLGGGEVTQEAVAGREPSYLEQLQIAAKRALQVGDVETAFKYTQAMQQQRVAEREQNAPVGNPYPTYDAQGNFVGTRVMTKAGQEVAFGTQGTTTVKPDVLTTKDKLERDFQERKFKAEQEKATKELALKEREITLKPNPINQAIEIEKGKEQVKQDNAIKAAQREKLTNANEGLPLLDNYINALKASPQSGFSELYQKGMGYIGNPLIFGDANKQAAMAKAKQAGEALLTFAQKQPGPSTDRDVASYRAQMGVVTDTSLPAPARVAAAEQAKALLLKIQSKFGNYQNAQPSPTTINHGDTLNQLPTTAPKGAVAKNAQTGKPEFIFNGYKWIPVGGSK
jgi:hypothetical protein